MSTMTRARLEHGAAGGLRPTGPGWYLANVDDLEHLGIPGHAYSALEGDGRWTQFGMGVDQLEPGMGNAIYHREQHEDETFLVLDGTCDAIIEGDVYPLDAGTLFHCPAGTAHAIVATGDRPCRIFMFGARGRVPEDGTWGEYLPEPHSRRLGVGIDAASSDGAVAYADRPDYAPVPAPTPFAIDRSPRTGSTTIGDGTNGSARLVDGPNGSRLPTTAGWFLLHVDDALWVDNGRTASALFGGGCDEQFQQYGVNLRVARPGAPICAYHRERHFDEAFFVLDGAGVLLVEGEEIPVRAGDLFWCPRGVGHVFVGGADAQLALLLVGTRDLELERADPESLEYPVDDLASTYGASASAHTFDPDEAYADWAESVPTDAPPWRWRG